MNSASISPSKFSALPGTPNAGRRGLTLSFAAVAVLLLCGSSVLRGQAYTTAARPLSFSSFVSGGQASIAWGTTPNKDTAVVFGSDLTRYYNLLQPSFEIRSTFATGPAVGQKTIDAGLKLEKAFRRYHPYGEFLYGYGVITFPTNPKYPRDNSGIPTYGGGLDYQVTRSLFARGDFQHQVWHTGNERSNFDANLVTLGFTYRPLPSRLIVR